MNVDAVKEELKKLDIENKKSDVVDADLCEKICDLLKQAEDVAGKAVLVELVGDLCRIEENRITLGELECNVIEILKGFSADNSLVLNKWIARALGNLAYEHEKNVDAIVADNGLQVILKSFLKCNAQNEEEKADWILLQRNTTGLIANISVQRLEIKESIMKLGDLITHIVGNLDLVTSGDKTKIDEMEQVLLMSFRFIRNISDSTPTAKQLESTHNVLTKTISLFKAIPIDSFYLRYAIENLQSLESLLDNDEGNLKKFLTNGGIQLLLGKVEESSLDSFTKSLEPMAKEEVEDSIADFKEYKELLVKIFVTIAEKESYRKMFKVILKRLLELVLENDVFLKKFSIQIISQLVLDDEIMEEIFKYRKELKSFIDAEDKEIQMYGTMIIGNLARNDGNCVTLVKEEKVADSLITLLGKSEGRIQHLAAGALRNLCISKENKPILSAKDQFWINLIELLKSTNGHVKFSVIQCIKSLLLMGNENKVKFAEFEDSVENLIRIKEDIIVNPDKDPDSDEKPDNRVQMEAARLLFLLTENAGDDLGGMMKKILELKGLGLTMFILKSEWEILQVEGLKTIRNLLKALPAMQKGEEDSEKGMKTNFHGILEEILVLVSSGKTRTVKFLAVSLLGEYGVQYFKEELLDLGVLDVLKGLEIDKDDGDMQKAVAGLIEKLSS